MEEQEKKDIWKAMYKVIFCFFVTGIATQGLGNFIPYMKELYGYDYNLSGILLSAHNIGNVVATLVAGILPFYIGRKKSVLLLGVSIVIAYFVFLFNGLSYYILFTLFVMIGISRGGDNNFTNTIASFLPDNSAIIGVNLAHAGYAVGAFLIPIIIFLFISAFDNRGYKFVLFLIFILCAIRFIIYATMKIPEIDKKESNLIKRKTNLDLRFFKNPKYILGTFIMFFYVSIEVGILGWLVTYFQDTGLLPTNISHIVNGLVWGMMFMGRFIGAKIGNKISKEKILIIDAIGMSIFFVVMLYAKTTLPLIISLLGTGFFMATIFTVAFAYGTEDVKENDFANAVIVFFGSMGGIIIPILIGFVAQIYGIKNGMWVIVICIGLLFVSTIISMICKKITYEFDI